MSMLGMLGAAVVGLLSAAQAKPCAPDHDGYCTSKIVDGTIGYEARSAIRINAALGDVVSISLPEGVELRGEPALGNQAIFEFKAESDPFRILVWPKVPAAAKDIAPDSLLGERSNMQIFLDSGVTVLVELKIGREAKSVAELRLEFPERKKESEFLRTKMEALSRKLEAQYQERNKSLDRTIEERARRRLAQAILDRIQCRELSTRKMVDLLVVRASRICRIGDIVFIEFAVKNRARDLFHLGEVRAKAAGSDEGDGDVELLSEFSGETTLAFDHEVRGVGAFTAAAENVARAYALTVEESGGKKRSVTLEGVEF